MRTLTYAGVDFSEFKCWWDGSQVFRKPNKIINRYQIPYRNGDLIRSTEAFENVEISFNCFIKEDYEENYSNLVNYLNSFDSYQRLETSAEPSIYRMALLHAVIEPETGQFLKDGRFTITFDCMPQEWLKSGENEMSIDMQTTTYTDPVEVDIEYDDALVDNAVLTLSPVQDLNGQAYPWIDKVGRNKLNLVNMAKTEMVNGITFTLTDEGKIYMNGTQDGSTTVTTWFPFASVETIPYGTYKISGLPSNMTFGDYGFSTIDSDQHITDHYENNSEVTDTIINFGVWVYEGVTVNNVELKPMIRESTDTSDVWQPYEHTTNICPIYPANGKNLLPTNLKYQKASTQVGIGTTGSYIHVDRGQYTLSVYFTEAVTGWSLYYLLEGGSATRIDNGETFSLDTSGNYLFYVYKSGGLSMDLVDKWQLEQGDTATSYVPYQSVVVQQTGINKFSFDNIASKYIYRANVQKITENSFYLGGAMGATDNMQLNVSSWAYVGLWLGFKTTEETTITVSCDVTNYLENCNGYMRIKYSDTQSGLASEQATNSPFNNVGTTHIVATATIPANKYVQIVFSPTSKGSTVTLPQFTEVTNFMLEYGDTESDFEPYQSNTYTSDLEQFVYGGTVDLVTGVLTVDKAYVVFDGSEAWTLQSINSYGIANFGLNTKLSNYKEGSISAVISDKFKRQITAIATTTDEGILVASGGYLYIRINSATASTVEDFKTWLASNNVQCVYDMGTPTTIQLTPQQIELLTGKNYFTAEQPLSVTITEGTTLTNPSYMKARPIIKLNGTGTGTVKLNGDVVVRVTEEPSNTPIYIDCENMNCYSYDEDGNVVNENGNVTLPEGYIEMEKGNNRFTATGQLEPTMIPRWWRL